MTLAVIDTSIPGQASGAVSADTLAWLDQVWPPRPTGRSSCSATTTPGPRRRSSGSPEYFGINPDDSERLVEVVARRPRIRGYFAGHTHRNRVRRFAATGDVPFVEVACVKDFPGAWAEYRVFEGGILQVVRRASSPEALAWSERTRDMFGGLYGEYALGDARRPLLRHPRRVARVAFRRPRPGPGLVV